MLVAERRREIGVLRAVGASRGDIRAVILGEALLIGTFGGGLGVLLAMIMGWLCDWLSATRIPEFPFKPETYFGFSPTLVVGAIGFAIVFCLVGALFPAQRAASLNPAEALSAR